MKFITKIIKNPVFWIFLLALFLRIYKLGEFPYGFHVDEVKVAWNALSILKTGHNDQNQILGLYYNSFGDYRPSGIFYFTIPSIAIFGSTEFATRFPTALFGALSVIPIYFLSEILRKNRKLKIGGINTGHLAAILLAISPWHIELSRATNEVVISTFFALSSLLFFIKLIKSKKWYFGIGCIASLTIAYFFYHAIRFLEPFILLFTYLFLLKEIKNKTIKVWVISSIAISIFLTAFFSINQSGLARLNQTSIFNNVDTIYEIQRIRIENTTKDIFSIIFDNKFVIYFKTFTSEYGKYFSEDFLTGGSARPYRFATPGVGLITYIEAILLIVGIIQILRGKKSLIPLFLLIIAPLPAALTSEDAPNLSRAFMMLPFLIIIEAYGLEAIFLVSKKFKSQIIITTTILLISNFAYFSYMYLNHSMNHRPYLKDIFVDSPTYRDVGAKELSLQLDNLSQKYSKVVITNFPDIPYPWYAFFTNKNPSDFNKSYRVDTMERVYGNIIFSQGKCPTDDLLKYNKQNILMIDSWECPYNSQISDGLPLKIVGEIKRSDGSMVYALLEQDLSKPFIIDGVTY